ncbi:prepilin-type N-terminal cleavage/methylation domain-containing protein [Pseudophaeobacter arcticus]|uniref:prepilin-type N-terminal cleavage/methylation domain-containing protein n=1 Tax=Pseudophaeobacter arcticus TaxID=385492 RepID=UPI003A9855DE
MDPELEPDSDRNDAGFTLIELLVSIAVLSVLALGATLALPRGSTPATQDMALFQRQFEQMRQLAITGQSSRGLIIEPEGLRLASRQASNQVGQGGYDPALGQDQTWQISPRQQRWQGRVQFIPLHSQGSAAASSGRPDIQFLADGRSSAFRIRFAPRSGSIRQGHSGARQASCRSDGRTGLICDSS